MRTIEEIKAELSQWNEKHELSPNRYTKGLIKLLENELKAAYVKDISADRLEEICKAEKDGRYVILPPTEESDYNGLKVKYRVFKANDNTPVENCFVLRPDKDKASRFALMTYATYCGNDTLAKDINKWICEMYESESTLEKMEGKRNEQNN